MRGTIFLLSLIVFDIIKQKWRYACSWQSVAMRNHPTFCLNRPSFVDSNKTKLLHPPNHRSLRT